MRCAVYHFVLHFNGAVVGLLRAMVFGGSFGDGQSMIFHDRFLCWLRPATLPRKRAFSFRCNAPELLSTELAGLQNGYWLPLHPFFY
jgi:hypothetical protein